MAQSRLKLFPIQLGVPPGLVKNKPAYLLPDGAYQDMLNAKMLNGTLKKAFGWKVFDDTALDSRIMHIDQLFLASGSDHLVVYTIDKMWRWNPGTSAFVDITGVAFTGDADNILIADAGFDLIVAANDIDAVRKWSGTGNEAVLGGLTDVEFLDGSGTIAVTTAAAIRFFKNFFVLLNVTENGTRKPSRVRWSRLGLPENWKNTAGGAGQAGAADIGSVDWILTGERLGDTLVIYKERSIWLMTYVGPPTIMAFREKIGGLGIVGAKAVASLGDEHLIVGNDDIYFFNGETVESVGENVRKYFFDNVDPSEISKTYIFIAEEDNEAVIAFVSTGSTNAIFDKGIVYNYLEKTWTLRELAHTAFGYYRRTENLTWADAGGTLDDPEEPGTWDERVFLDNAPLNLLGTNGGYIHQIDGVSKDGTALEMTATTKLYDFGAPQNYKRLQRIQVMANQQSQYNLTIEVGTSENMNDDPTWHGPFTYDLSVPTSPFIDLDVSGRFFTFRISQDGLDQDVTVTALICYYMLKGTK